MNDYEIPTLILTAIWLGFFHTIIEPNHYIPFIALSENNKWNLPQTIMATIFCGAGHIISSLLVAGLGIILGAGIGIIDEFDHFRNIVTLVILFGFGATYFIYGLKESKHCHTHKNLKGSKDFWILFIIFTLGPCHILSPLVVYPAANFDWSGVVSIIFAFSTTTIITMLALVIIIKYGLKKVSKATEALECYGNTLTGIVLMLCAVFMYILNHHH